MKPLLFVAILIALTVQALPVAASTKRSQTAIVEFKKAHCLATGASKGPCKGYVIDHITALACGGADSPSNMQWQTVAEAKEKDKWERRECGKGKQRD